MEDIAKPLACSADMLEVASTVPTDISGENSGELRVSRSLPNLAQLSWSPVPEDDTIVGNTVKVGSPIFIFDELQSIVMEDVYHTGQDSDLSSVDETTGQELPLAELQAMTYGYQTG